MKYDDSGVSIERAERAKASIARLARSTWGPSVLSDTGAFGGLFSLGTSYKDPVLVSSIDGVGTKLLVAVMANCHDTVGRDLVNHSVNDILVQGARPLFFLDYIASGVLEPDKMEATVSGIAEACRANSCALIGGETAEMPGVYQGRDFDLAGCIVGAVEKSEIIDGSTIRPGDSIVGLASTGLHTNGYSLARKIIFDELRLAVADVVDELGCTVAEELLRVHASYLEPITRIMASVRIKGIAHITGGGIPGNLPRILPATCNARINKGSWPIPGVFAFLQKRGSVGETEMYRVFNMGIGMLLVVAPKDRDAALALGSGGCTTYLVGEIETGDGQVLLT
ncbi:MAG: phosphoribosylformylglycinamidine cyclo-ligase [Candidatus Krumholzibacteria bacterium]|nr:phosphoribosylformylglycinamidine cyclo-ligase [Candidatus Krumholzibacteria bacterium]